MPRFYYVEVHQGEGQGFWEIDTEEKKALFRDYDHKRVGDPKTDGKLHDWTEIYSTVADYINKELKIQWVKETIPGTKVIFSKEGPFCAHWEDSVVAFDPGRKRHCSALAEVIHNSQPMCKKHAHVNV